MIRPPLIRRLRVLTFDPSLMTQLDFAPINEVTAGIPWEDDLQPGPVGEYIEVIDYDPASGAFYEPVDLNDPHLLAQDGLGPSESDPRFHQQMVYAVAMTTVRHFERALGRLAFWADHTERVETDGGVRYAEQFVRRLRVYPHALRARNAYYSPAKKALLFGYFPVTAKDAHNTPGTVVFTCLSHDIIVHEVTHALLDGVHPRFNEPTNPDVHAFHEAFADIVALFQHFTYPAVLESQIGRTRGNLDTENLLGELAQQFGRATGRGGALRGYLGHTNPASGEWEPLEPDARALERTPEPHARGAILVAAVFRAFRLIYRSRSADLFRIASQGTGTLPEGDIHPDLTRRLAAEAASCADRVLQMCIRAIDYCPPVDVTFGDFLRGVITADLDVSPYEDSYRIAFIQSFREWGIHPRRVTSMSLDALTWPSGSELMGEVRGLRRTRLGEQEKDNASRRSYTKGSLLQTDQQWNLESDRYELWRALDKLRAKVWIWLKQGDHYGRDYAELFGLVIDDHDAAPTVYRNEDGEPTMEVHAVRPAVRPSMYGGARTDLVIEITQRRRGYFDEEEQREMDAEGNEIPRGEHGDFIYRTGCTVILDQATQEVRRVIRTPGTVNDDDELRRVRRFLKGEVGVTGNAFDAGLSESLSRGRPTGRDETFALLHLNLED